MREQFEDEPNVIEKKMFGGLAFMVNGHMCCGVMRDQLMCRVGADSYEATLKEPHARKMDFTGKALKGFVYVSAEGFADDSDLSEWVRRSRSFVATLPPKLEIG